jgi:hypothetical protein
MAYDKIIELLDEVPQQIEQRNKETEDKLFDYILLYILRFNFDSENRVEQTDASYARFNGLVDGIEEYLYDSGFSDTIAYFQSKVEQVKGLINEEFDLSNESEMLRNRLKAGQDEVEEIAAEDIRSASKDIATEIASLIVFLIVAGSNRASIEDSLEDLIIGNSSKLGIVSHNTNTRFDSVFSAVVRAYANSVYTLLGIKEFKYEGGLIKDSRPFCIERNGNTYNTEQIKSWANLPPWRGRMPGTTEETIFFYLGGYRCRHWLVPIKNAEQQTPNPQ